MFALAGITEGSTGRRCWKGPVATCRLEIGRFPGVRVQCVLSVPERKAMPASVHHAIWFSSTSVTRSFRLWYAQILGNHRTWGTKSLQTLQRVGSMIRSTSLEAIAALATKRGAAASTDPQQIPPGQNPPEPNRNGIKPTLSRFLTVASKGEITEAAMLSDLSNMAYDVQAISEQHLQDTHKLKLITHSKAEQESPVGATQASPFAGQTPAMLADGRSLQDAIVALQNSSSAFAAQLLASPAVTSNQQQVWDAAPIAHTMFAGASLASSSCNAAGHVSAPASPRSHMLTGSYSESDGVTCADIQYAATAAAAVASPETPTRLPSALAAAPAAAGMLPMAADVTVGKADGSSVARGPSPAQTVQQWPTYTHADQPQHGQPSLLALQQQQQMLLSMQHNQQQLMVLLQQEQALLQQQQMHAATSQQQQQQQRTSSTQVPAPAEWFVCDGPATLASAPTRYFVIQGSITLEHWRINLTIDPVSFEGGAFGPVKVHRGVYEAALTMYDAFVPLVKAHLAHNPDGKIAFTGHSLGGSLATLLMLLLVYRGVLPAANVAAVHTFGSPAIFCEGATGSAPAHEACRSCGLPCKHRRGRSANAAVPSKLGHIRSLMRNPGLLTDAYSRIGRSATRGSGNGSSSSRSRSRSRGARSASPAGLLHNSRSTQSARLASRSLRRTRSVSPAIKCNKSPASGASADEQQAPAAGVLAQLGLSLESVVNVVMTRDIVPRAFICDYTLVADVLKSWLPSFQEHVGLASCKQHKALYSFVGTVKVLQPSMECPFVLPDEGHAMLPPHAALYKLTEPSCSPAQLTAGSTAPVTAVKDYVTVNAAADSNNSAPAEANATASSSSNNDRSSGSTITVSGAASKAYCAGTAAGGSSNSEQLVTVAAATATAILSSEAAGMAAAVLLPDCSTALSADAACTSVSALDAAAADLTASGSEGMSLTDAILTFMNSPHPLETLGEMRAYGPAGSISRFHNPASYTMALQHLSSK